MTRSTVLASVLFSSLFCASASDITIKRIATSQTSPASGQQMYENYCAVCHGNDGRGSGPAASALKTAPTDLTALASHNNGKFPELHVYAAIQGDRDVPAHGSKDMPVWGDVFQAMSRGSSGEVQMRISNLVQYVKGLQTK